MCMMHCTRKTHGHCAEYYCDKTQDICEETSMCETHCTQKTHGHCFAKACNLRNIHEETEYCKYHHFFGDIYNIQ